MPLQETLEHWLGQIQQLPYVSSFMPDRVEPTPPADTWFAGRFDDIPKSAWLIIWPLALIVLLWFFLVAENDQPIRYRVPSPKVPDQEEILTNPTIKVRLF